VRFSALKINGFGIFHEQEAAELSPGLNLFLGDNEAGKSTLLAFIRAVLFGFPRANSRDPSYPPLTGGIHGGGIDLMTTSGRAYCVERRPGRGGGEVKVSCATGDAGSEETLQQLLAGITYEAFRNIYAFSLSELQSFDSLRAESVKNVIYGATAGAAVMALPRAEKGLREGLEALFKSGGSKPRINVKLAELEDLASKLRRASAGVAEYDACCNRVREVDAEIAGVREERSRVWAEKTTLARYLSVFDDFRQLQADEAALEALEEEVLSFPAEGLLRLQRAAAQLEELESQKEQLQEHLARRRGELSRIQLNTSILQEAETIGLLLENKRDFLDKIKRIPAEERERDSLAQALAAGIAGLGPDWSAARVMAVDRSVFTREAILQHQEKQRGIEKARASALELLGERDRQLREAEEALREASAALDAVGETPSPRQEEVLSGLEQGRSEFVSAVRDLPHRRSELEQERKRLSAALAEIDGTFTESQALAFDLSLAARSAVARFDDTLRRHEAELQLKKGLLSAKEEACRSVTSRIEQLEARIAELGRLAVSAEDLEKRKRATRDLAGFLKKERQLVREIEHLRERIADKRRALEMIPSSSNSDQSLGMALMPAALVAALVAMALLSFVRIEYAIFAGLVAGFLFFWLYHSRRLVPSPGSDHSHQSRDLLRKEMTELESHLETTERERSGPLTSSIEGLLSDLGLPAGTGIEGVEKIEEDLEADGKRLARRENLLENLAQLSREKEVCRHDVERVEREVQSGIDQLAETREQWAAFVTGTGLDPALLPSVVGSVFSKIEASRQRIEGVRSLDLRIGKIQALVDSYRGTAAEIFPDGADLPESHDEFIRRLDRRLAERKSLRERYSLAATAREDKERNLAQVFRSRAEAENKREKIEQQMNEGRVLWERFLQEQGLPAQLSPETAVEAYNRVDECVRQIMAVNRLDAEISSLREDTSRYEADAQALHQRLGRSARSEERLVVAVDQLVTELDSQKQNAQSRAELEKQVQDCELRLQVLEERMRACLENRRALLDEAGARDADDFRRKECLYSRRAELLSSIAGAEKRLRALNEQTELSELKAKLAAMQPEEIPGQIREWERLAEEQENHLEELRKTRAEVCQRIASLESSDEVASLRLDEERLLAELREAALSWAKLAMAQHLIRKAKQIYEKQQQPRVVREAEGFFRRITGGRYTQLLAPIGEESIEVVDAGRNRRKPDELSRGTAEQLYLALRFGYIRSRAENAESLPVIMDDILVNFDPSRARRAAEAILDLATGQQVLFFTCHPETVDLFRTSSGNGIPTWQITDGGIMLADRR
jgi:uncharacterized protein YhaN